MRGREAAGAAQAIQTTTLGLWQRHSIRQAGLTVLVGEGGNQDLHYLLAWESLAERETKWNRFASDPEWLAKRAESERDGPIVASITNMFPAADGVLGGSEADRCPRSRPYRPCGARSRRGGRALSSARLHCRCAQPPFVGTHNHLVQLPGFFIELLTVVEPKTWLRRILKTVRAIQPVFPVEPGRTVAADSGKW